MNKFYEQFITKDYKGVPNAVNVASKSLLLLCVVFISFFGIIWGVIFSMPVIILFIIVEMAIAKSFLEYEYEYYDDEITISKIINKRKRKVIGSFNTKNISKVSTFNNVDKSAKIVRCTIKGLNLKEIVVFANDNNNRQVGYLMGIDENLHSILKKDNPSLFNYI